MALNAMYKKCTRTYTLYLSREQRVTLFVMAVLVGVSMMLYHALRLLPLPVLYGIFLYIGVASLYGVQVSGWQLLETSRTHNTSAMKMLSR